MAHPLIKRFLLSGLLGGAVSFGVFVAVWALNSPPTCPVTRVLAGQRCPGTRTDIVVNAAITVAILAVTYATAAVVYRRRLRAKRTDRPFRGAEGAS